jgi:predicted amidophosphoribosyltransferase
MRDDTDKEFFPCACGFQFCCFCYNKMREVGDHFRCPACRKPFDSDEEQEESSSGSDSEEDSDDSDGPSAL